MKKILLTTCVLSLALGAKAFAADTYTGALVDSLNQKINKVASPVMNKEKEIQAQQKSLQNLPQQKMNTQQDLVNKKKQEIQKQKNLLNQEKSDLKNLFQLNQ
jgi:hypothetical protein